MPLPTTAAKIALMQLVFAMILLMNVYVSIALYTDQLMDQINDEQRVWATIIA